MSAEFLVEPEISQLQLPPRRVGIQKGSKDGSSFHIDYFNIEWQSDGQSRPKVVGEVKPYEASEKQIGQMIVGQMEIIG